MPIYTCVGTVHYNGLKYPNGSLVDIPAGSVRDGLLTVGAIFRHDLPPYRYRDVGEMKLVPAKSDGLSRVIVGQRLNPDYVELMHRLGFPLTDEGRRGAVQRYSGLVNMPEFTIIYEDPPLPPLDPALWTVPWLGSWVWVPRTFFTGRPACAELPIP